MARKQTTAAARTDTEPQRPSFRVILSGGSGEITEKRSRFIGEVFSVESAEAAQARIDEVTKRTWDARHHCHAFVVGTAAETARSSDNGEPSGTAGKPILEVIRGARLTNTLIVVTRYFGGVLLGTGGLVRAYTQAAQAGLSASTLGELVLARPMDLTLPYELVDPVRRLLRERGLAASSEDYGAQVRYTLSVRADAADELAAALTQLGGGRITTAAGAAAYTAVALTPDASAPPPA